MDAGKIKGLAATRGISWARTANKELDLSALSPREFASEAEITKEFQGWVEQGFPGVDLTLTPIQIYGVGDLAYVVNKVSATFTAPGSTEPQTPTGKDVVVLRKQDDGSWKMVVDIWNSDQPATPAEE